MGFGIMMQGGRVMNLSEKLLKLRKQSGLSQQELADQLNVSRQSVSKWELNESVPDISNILALSEIYHVSTDYLLGFQVSNRTLDVSGLTRAEYTMIADLVESMSEKNKKLEDM